MANDDHLPVYDAEIIDASEGGTKVMPVQAQLPEKKLAYRLGKAAGAIFAGSGFLNEFRHLFRTRNTGGRDMGKRKRRRKGKMRRFT